MKPNELGLRIRGRNDRAAIAAVLVALGAAACSGSSNGGGGSGSNGGGTRVEGQSDFTSSPPGQSFGGHAESASSRSGGGTLSAPGVASDNAAKGAAGANANATTRTVEETDLYRVDGNRLYYLNGYRGLMIFDISNIDHPKLIGRSAIYGSPVEMIVRNGVAIVVVADWYGSMENGTPFHGSIVRAIDASDPDHIVIRGEAPLGGWVRDTRVVGDVLYAVSEVYPWWGDYGWADLGGVAGGGVAVSSGSNQSQVVVSSVSFHDNDIKQVSSIPAPGYGGIFNVTLNSILFAHNVQPTDQKAGQYVPATQMALEYLDISDPGGVIKQRGKVVFNGTVPDWGTDNGRWNLDFADGQLAHVLGHSVDNFSGQNQGYVLATADFSNPDAPVALSSLPINGNGWTPAARFDHASPTATSIGRMYLAPDSYYYYGGGVQNTTPVQVFDLTDPKAPKLAGQTSITGSVWNFTPSGDGTRLFALGNDGFDPTTQSYGSQISLRYLDVTDPAHPTVLGAPSTFGQGWAWTPAAGTFKAFTMNKDQQLVVLPFSGWSPGFNSYNNGLQLIEFTPEAIRTAGAAHTKGWVERGVFAKGSAADSPTRLLSLSDLSLSVVDFSSHDDPKVAFELPLARNVVDARPTTNGTIAQLSSDWWYENDQEHSDLRVLPIEAAEENKSELAVAEIPIDGVNSQVFHNGALSYVVSSVRRETPCLNGAVYAGKGPVPGASGGSTGTPDNQPKCYTWNQQVQIVDLSTTPPKLRGKLPLPDFQQNYYWYYGGFAGCYIYDWYNGADVVQVGGDKLAFRRWVPEYAGNQYVDSYEALWVMDLANPDAPTLASTVITHDSNSWWGDMRAVGDKLYTTHYEWFQRPVQSTNEGEYVVRYYLDQIDLTDPTHPRIGAKINVPGILVGASEADPNIIYTIDYRWNNDHGYNDFDVLQLAGDKAYLKSSMEIPGYVGNTLIRGNKAYMSVQQYADQANYSKTYVRLWQLDLSNPSSISPTVSAAEKGWGWLLGVEGDRALVTSGWGGDGIDIYKLSDQAPQFDQFVRTLGWGTNSMARLGDQIFLASGHWGVQTVNLK